MSNPYYLDHRMVEHGCCRDMAIARKCEPGQGQYGEDVELVAECRAEDAPTILAALNAALTTDTPTDKDTTP